MAANPDDWKAIVRHYEARLSEHGATPQGADWPNGPDLAARFGVMLDLLDEGGERPSLLDLGCGAGLLLDYLAATGGVDRVHYRGIDLSPEMVSLARQRWPDQEFEARDILAAPLPDQSIDFVLMNGVLTERVSLSVEAMTALAEALVATAFRVARMGIAFNVMSAHVDWERPDLFHWRFDAMSAFIQRAVSRHFAIRADYGLYEFTCFVRRHPLRPPAPKKEDWWSR
jgi:SAM-dependent methyltransferase